MTKPFDGSQGEAGCGDLKGEAFADEPGELGGVVENIDCGCDAAGAVTEQEDR